jgi:hypothetical protein
MQPSDNYHNRDGSLKITRESLSFPYMVDDLLGVVCLPFLLTMAADGILLSRNRVRTLDSPRTYD